MEAGAMEAPEGQREPAAAVAHAEDMDAALAVLMADLSAQHERLRRVDTVLQTALSASQGHLDQIEDLTSRPAAAECPSGTYMPLTWKPLSLDLEQLEKMQADPVLEVRPVFTSPCPVMRTSRKRTAPATLDLEDVDEENNHAYRSEAYTGEASISTPGSVGGCYLDFQTAPSALSAVVQVIDHSESEIYPSGRLKADLPTTSTPELVAKGDHLSASELLLETCSPLIARTARATEVASKAADVATWSMPGDTLRRRRASLASGKGYSSEKSNWSQELGAARRNAIFRLRARLGKTTFRGAVTSVQVHKSLIALGLVKYTCIDIDRWMYQLKIVVWDNALTQDDNGRASQAMKLIRRQSRGTRRADSSLDEMPDDGQAAIHFKAFVEALLNDELLSNLEPECQQMSLTIREVLFSGDANRLVAELTHVRVDDVAAPPERPDLITKVEPILALVILANGIFIGLQTDPEAWGAEQDRSQSLPRVDRWFWGNVAFTAIFLIEVLVRMAHTGCVKHILGPERTWNLFDFILLLMSTGDVLLDALSANSNLTPLTILRVMRLTRLTRLLRIFRLRYMRELNLMVRGLLGGLYTLFWAVVLLFFTLYVIGVMATTTIGYSQLSPEINRDELFSTVPQSVLTSFRCFMGDCNTSDGKPIVKLLEEAYGGWFVICYLASMIFVVFGLFNLIVAVYIENTMNAAKMDGEKTKQERHRESIRVARLSRQLLKKFIAAQKQMSDEPTSDEFKHALKSASFDDVGEACQPISKEIFLCVIQDASVQKIMDELDIPADRAGLFDVLDADCSGGLEVAELITGLLQVRGEARKCDVVGAVLAVRALQDMIREQDDKMTNLEDNLQCCIEKVAKLLERSSARSSAVLKSSCDADGCSQCSSPSGGDGVLMKKFH